MTTPFFHNATATTDIYTLSLHDALPIYLRPAEPADRVARSAAGTVADRRENTERSWWRAHAGREKHDRSAQDRLRVAAGRRQSGRTRGSRRARAAARPRNLLRASTP